MEKFKERERRYSEKLRNGTPEERERERVFQQELKRNGGYVTDIMERRRYGALSETLSDWFTKKIY